MNKKLLSLIMSVFMLVSCMPLPTDVPPTETAIAPATKTFTSTATLTKTLTPTVTATASITKTATATGTATKTATATVTPTVTPTQVPGEGIGPIELVYKQGGIWMTPEDIALIPTDNEGWESLVEWANKPMDIVDDLTHTAGGAGSGEAQSPRAILARAIVGFRTGDEAMLQEARNELDLYDEAVARALDELNSEDEKWAQRSTGPIAVAANILDYRPQPLLDALYRVIYVEKFDGNRITIYETGMRGLTNKAAWGRWSTLTTAYLLEDFETVEASVKAHAKAMGEPLWGGEKNDHVFKLSGTGSKDDWQTLQPGGKEDPIAVMPAGTMWEGHGVGGLWLADQYRSGNGPTWPPVYTNYVYEGSASYQAVAWAANHLGYENVFELGDYALLRSMLFNYAEFDGKASWPVESNDTWQSASIMTWAWPEFGNDLPEYLLPESGIDVPWPLLVSPGGAPGRGMGFMYATHYATKVIGIVE